MFIILLLVSLSGSSSRLFSIGVITVGFFFFLRSRVILVFLIVFISVLGFTHLEFVSWLFPIFFQQDRANSVQDWDVDSSICLAFGGTASIPGFCLSTTDWSLQWLG